MASTRGRQVVIPLTNKSGGSVAAGDVVIMDTANDTAFTTTTTGRFEGVVGIAQEAIANNATGRVLIQGYAALVNVPASVTRGHYIETHTVAKQATGSSSRRSGSFGLFLTGGTSPTAVLGGLPDQTASGGSSSFVGVRAYNSGTQNISATTITPVTFDSEDGADANSLHSVASNTNRFVADRDGRWMLRVGVSWDTDTSAARYLWIRKNGSDVNGGGLIISGTLNSAGYAAVTALELPLVATDWMEAVVYQTSGGTRTIGNAGGDVKFRCYAEFRFLGA